MYFFILFTTILILRKKKFETSLESYGWRCIGLSCKLSKTASYFSRPTHNCIDEMTCARSLFHAFFADNDGWHVTAVDLLS